MKYFTRWKHNFTELFYCVVFYLLCLYSVIFCCDDMMDKLEGIFFFMPVDCCYLGLDLLMSPEE